jgi:hypothetical protein
MAIRANFLRNFSWMPIAGIQNPTEDNVMQGENDQVRKGEAGDDDDIIELTDMIDPPEQADGDAIELTDMIDPPEQADGDAIELTDMIDPPMETQGDIIEMTDTDEPQPLEGEGTLHLSGKPSEPPPEPPGKELDLSQLDLGPLEDSPTVDNWQHASDEDTIEMGGLSGEPPAKPFAGEDTFEGDFENAFGVEVNEEALADERPAKPSSAGQVFEESQLEALTPERLEAALERVIHKVFSEKIEGMLIEAIERTVTEEINRLKKALRDEISGANG